MKKSKIPVIISLIICGAILISCVVFVILNPRFFQTLEFEASNSKLFSSWVSDANEVIEQFDDTSETGEAADAYYKAFVHFYGPVIALPNSNDPVLLPTDENSIPNKGLLNDKIKAFCKKHGKEVIEGTYNLFVEQGYITDITRVGLQNSTVFILIFPLMKVM